MDPETGIIFNDEQGRFRVAGRDHTLTYMWQMTLLFLGPLMPLGSSPVLIITQPRARGDFEHELARGSRV